MWKLKFAAILFCALLTLTPSNILIADRLDIPETVVNTTAGQKMHTYLERLSGLGFHGTALVARNDEIVLHQTYGLADVSNQIPNYTSTLFSTGSVTKQFTAAAIMLLESRGKLNIDDPIGKYFDSIPADKSAITIHHLLTHTSGLAHDYGADEDVIGRDIYIADVLAQPLQFEPGQKYSYSNAGYSLLAAIIEIAGSTDYEAFLQQNFFEPLGMNSTGLHLLQVNDTLIARSHNEQLGYPSAADRPEDCWNLLGNGGILSSTADMYRWYTALKGSEILPPETTRRIFTPYVKEYPDMESYYGYGWVIQDSERRDSKVIWHNGGAMLQGWSCAVYDYVDDSAVFIVFSNKPMDGILPVDYIAVNLSQILFGESYDLPPQTAQIDDSLLMKLEDLYLLNDDDLIRVAVSDGTLRLYPIGQKAVDAVFPSLGQNMLPEYNDKTDEMLKAFSNREFTSAAAFWEKQPGINPEAMLMDWWSSFDSLGQVRNYVILGTRMVDGAETYVRVNFENGAEDLMFVWMQGLCQGAMSGKKLTKVMHPVSKMEFISYSLTGQDSLNVIFQRDNKMVIKSGSRSITAERK
ncbi:MAG TPA: class A beta-lactamase-related serine hydrolase [candidate division Zixibacteria bacterium]|nr:class A beta-lactamase-related serine hydrolase [candidate division Zixibacteria bacterium]